ncbi:MAG: MATE family efflux transporter [Bacteroidales bacterium]
MLPPSSRTLGLETTPIAKLLWQYALPAIIGMGANAMYNIADRIFIGQGVGALAISGLALTLPLLLLFTAIGTLVGVGASSRISIVLGMKDRDRAQKILGNATFLTLLLSTLVITPCMFFLDELLTLFGGSPQTVPYAKEYLQIIIPGSIFTNFAYNFANIMRATGYPHKSMRILLSGVLLNLILTPLFIFGFHMGIRGGAIATVISMFTAFLLALRHFRLPNSEIRLDFDHIKPEWHLLRDILSIGLSPFMMHVTASGVNLVMNHHLLQYGGDLAVGAYGIINSYAMLIIMLVMGFCQGMQPIVGYNYGAGKMKRMKDALLLTIRLTFFVMLTGFAGAQFFSKQIAQAFTNDPQLIAIIGKGMPVYLMALPLVGFQITISNFFLSIGKAGISMFMSLSRQLIFLIPALLLFSHLYGLNGIWIAGPVSDATATFVAAFFLIRQRKIFYRR